MSARNACLSLQAFFVLEGQRMVKSAVRVIPGDKIEAQIARAAINLKLPFDFAWRVWQGRCGARAFLKLYAAYRAFEADQKRADNAAEIVDRLDRLDRSLAELADRISPLAREASHSRRGGHHRLIGMGGATR